MWGFDGGGCSIVGVICPPHDEPDGTVGSKSQNSKDGKNQCCQNKEHYGVTPQFKHSLNPVTGIRLSIAGV